MKTYRISYDRTLFGVTFKSFSAARLALVSLRSLFPNHQYRIIMTGGDK